MGRRFISLVKDNLMFQPPAQSRRGFEELGSSKFKKNLKSMASLRRNRDLPDAPVIKPIIMVICLKFQNRYLIRLKIAVLDQQLLRN
jgi:hypothetical protein